MSLVKKKCLTKPPAVSRLPIQMRRSNRLWYIAYICIFPDQLWANDDMEFTSLMSQMASKFDEVKVDAASKFDELKHLINTLLHRVVQNNAVM